MIKKGSTIPMSDIYSPPLPSSSLEKSIHLFFQESFNSFLHNQFVHNLAEKENKDPLCLICDQFLYSEAFVAKNSPYNSKASLSNEFYCPSCIGQENSLKKYFYRGLWSLYTPPTVASSSSSTPTYKGYSPSLSSLISSLDSETSSLINFSLQFLTVTLTNFFQLALSRSEELSDLWGRLWEEIFGLFPVDAFLSAPDLLSNQGELAQESFFLVHPWLVYESDLPLQSFLSFSMGLLSDSGSQPLVGSERESLLSKVQDFLSLNLTAERWATVLLLCDSFSYRFSLLNTPLLSLGQSLPLLASPKERHDLASGLFAPFLDDLLISLEGPELHGGYPARDGKKPRAILPFPWCIHEVELDYVSKKVSTSEENHRILSSFGERASCVSFQDVFDIKERLCARVAQAASSLGSTGAVSAAGNPFLPYVFQSSFLHPFLASYTARVDEARSSSLVRPVVQSCQANLLLEVSHSSQGLLGRFVANTDVPVSEDLSFSFNHHQNPTVDPLLLIEAGVVSSSLSCSSSTCGSEVPGNGRFFPVTKSQLVFAARHALFLRCSCPLCDTSAIDLYSLSYLVDLRPLKSLQKKIQRAKKSRLLSGSSKFFTKTICLRFCELLPGFEALVNEFRRDPQTFDEESQSWDEKFSLPRGPLQERLSRIRRIVSYANSVLAGGQLPLGSLYYAAISSELFHLLASPGELFSETIEGFEGEAETLSKKSRLDGSLQSRLLFSFFVRHEAPLLGGLLNSFSAMLFDLMISLHADPSDFLEPLSASLEAYSASIRTSKNGGEPIYEVRHLLNVELVVRVARLSHFFGNQPSEVSDFLNKFDTYESEGLALPSVSSSVCPFDQLLEIETKPGEMARAFLTSAPLLSQEECEAIVQTAREYASRHEGWTTSRHYSVPTTDIPVHSLVDYPAPTIASRETPRSFPEWFRSLLDDRIRPLLLAQFASEEALGKSKSSLSSLSSACHVFINDLFIVKYEGQELPETTEPLQKSSSQKYLPLHTDQSTHSFTIAINPRDSFQGGGTYFSPQPLHRAVRAEEGQLVSFNGGLLHGGEPVHSGTRYIIAGFTLLLPRHIPLDQWLDACEKEENVEEHKAPCDDDEVETSLGSIFSERQKRLDDQGTLVDFAPPGEEAPQDSGFSFSFF